MIFESKYNIYHSTKCTWKCGLKNVYHFIYFYISDEILTHWGRVTHICVSTITIIGSDNGLSPDRRQAIIRTNAGLLLIGPLGTNFSEFLIEILTFSFKKMRLKVSSAKQRPFCLGLNVLSTWRVNRIILTWDKLQQPQAPDFSLQHVWPSAHTWVSSHFTVRTGEVVSTRTCCCHGNDTSPLTHLPLLKSHLVFSGQQWRESLQQTACYT